MVADKPNAIALKCAEGSYCWSELFNQVASVQKQLLSQGINAGDVLMLITAHSSLHSLLVYLAALEEGIVVAFIPPLSHSELLKRQGILQSAACYTCPSLDPSYTTQLHSIEIDFTLPVSTLLPATSYTRFFTHIASLIFTSGSTGEPKAVAHSASNHLASAIGLQKGFKFGHDSHWLLSLPLFHVSGLAIVWRWLLSGCCLSLKQGKSLNLQGISHTSMVPTQLLRVLQTEQAPRLTLERVLLGGAIIPQQLAHLAQARGIDTWAGYGLTEMASTVSAKRVNELDSAGSALEYRQIKLQQQHIFVRGDTLALGYWKQGKVQPLTLSDGWFDTKDLGRWQNDELVIIGRADNQFISGGENIHCEEIERVLLEHSQVEQAFIVPIPDETFGHRPVALLTLSDNTLSLKLQVQLQHLSLSKLQKFKCPIAYYQIPEHLLNKGIKISRAQLHSWLSQKMLQQQD
ncbi:o-succinylbenzoate--CoA ligase [Vibrio rarus]